MTRRPRCWWRPCCRSWGHSPPGLSFDLSINDRRVDLVEEGVDLAIRSGPPEDSTALAARPSGLPDTGPGRFSPEYSRREKVLKRQRWELTEGETLA